MLVFFKYLFFICKMKKIIASLTISGFFLIPNISFSQGCSDAGICNIGSINSQKNEIPANNIQLIGAYGSGDNNVSIYNTAIEGNFYLKELHFFQVKLNTQTASGDLGTFTNAGDLILSFNPTLTSTKFGKLKTTIGLKLPLNDADRKVEELPLPMVYQSSLGTRDLLAGLTYIQNNWTASLAFQIPLNQNRNQFSIDDWTLNTQYQYVNQFESTKNFKRASDMVFRFDKKFLFKKIDITPGVLTITHLANDKYTDANGVEKEIIASQGVTMNATLKFGYKLSDKIFINSQLAAPFLVRKVRPDGLTRSFVCSFGIGYKF